MSRLNGHMVPLYRTVLAGIATAAAIGAWTSYGQLSRVSEAVVQLDKRIEDNLAFHQRQLDNHEARIQRVEGRRPGPM